MSTFYLNHPPPWPKRPALYLHQAIHTKVRVNRNGIRCASARCNRGSVRRQLPYDVTGDTCHQWILTELLTKFAKQDPDAPWPTTWAGGILPDGTAAWVEVQQQGDQP